MFQSAEHWNQAATVSSISDELAVKFLGESSNAMITGSVVKDKVLDVATGTGLLAFMIEEKYPEASVTGIDFAEVLIKKAIEKKSEKSKIDFLVMDGQDLKFADNTFDNVFANMGVMFYPDIVKGLKELLRVMKPGGSGGFTTWTEDFPAKGVLNALIELNLMEKKNSPVLPLTEPKELEQKLKEAGYESYEIIQQDLCIKVTKDEYLQSMRHMLLKHEAHLAEIHQKMLELATLDEDNKVSIYAKANVVLFKK